jgi:acyl-coenzyme A synthetase/AMP-(fatty) acid ligase
VLVLVLRLEQGQEFSRNLQDDILTRNRKLPDFKRVGGYILWDEDFPRTASMKIKRMALAEEISKKTNRTAVVAL